MNLSDASRGEDQPKVLPSNRVVINAVEIINQRQSLVWNYKRVLRIEDKNFSKQRFSSLFFPEWKTSLTEWKFFDAEISR